ncbi:hypothetical protein BCR44DRAFT_24160 [Catenaria anguillulae PL171]|uniref:Zinc finger C2H2 LYAR-type domain-containing protein n=1 Tax=Catenaria anguillulae PL171 TaxID=765915 RepID=A0A1Y2HDN1_9FUNG|nr:hypothetical protein BCR44DRAFT_24160 [Catenaria anguillulae PL171]
MVSFCCDHCQEIIKKPKAEMHVRRCHPASLSCVDCYKTFTGTAFKAHTSCITEEQKFHGKLYKENNGKGANGKQQQQKNKQHQNAPKPAPTSAPTPAPVASAPAAAESKKRSASAANASSSSDSSSSSSDSESDAEPAKKKAKTAEAVAAPAGPSGEDVKKAIGALGEAKSLSYKELVKRTVKAVRKAHSGLDKGKAKKLVKDTIRFNLAGGKVSLA